MIPAEIANSTINVQAWYMYSHMAMTLEEVGRELHYSDQGTRHLIERAFKKASVANIYKHQIEYCRNDCKTSVSECRECNLYKFMLTKMVRKQVRE